MTAELSVLAVKRLARFGRSDLIPIIVTLGLACIDDGVGLRGAEAGGYRGSGQDCEAAIDESFHGVTLRAVTLREHEG
jgi:hypothetical protein